MRCVLIGYGYWGKIIERYIKASYYFELVGICDPNFSNSMTMEDILKNHTIECAFVCTPVDLHFGTVKALLENNIHVFCEKPLCKKKGDIIKLMQLAHNRGLVLFTDYIYTVSPSLQYIKKHITSLGKIQYIDMSIKQFGRFYKTDNVFEVIGVHMISALIYLLDTKESDIQILSVDIVKNNRENLTEAGIAYFQVQDTKGKIECSLLSDSKERKITILCEQGVIVFDMLGSYTVKFISHLEKKGQKIQEVLYEQKYDENNNLTFMLTQFYQTILSKCNFNERITVQTANVLEQINRYLKK